MRLAVLKCIFTFAFIALAINSSGKNFPMLHYTVENGLPSNTVYAITGDTHDFLWFATEKGVVRYNGIEFEKFTTSDGLPDNDVFWMQEDKEQRVWANCYNGKLCYYSYKDGKFHNEQNTPFLKIPFKHSSFLTKIEIGADSSLTFLFLYNNYILNIHGEQTYYFEIKKDKVPELLRYPGVISARKLAGDKYELRSPDSSIFVIDTACNIISKTINKHGRYSCSSFEGKEWLHSSKGIFSMDEQLLLKFTNKDLIKASIYRTSNNDGNWFIGTTVGLFINNDLQILKGQRVTSVKRDKEGNYWISVQGNGVYYLAKDFLNTEQYDNIYSGHIDYARAIGKYIFYTTNNRNLYRIDNGKPVLLFDYYKHFAQYYSGIEEWRNFSNANYNYGKLVDNEYHYYNFDDLGSFVIDQVNTNKRQVHAFPEEPILGHIKEMIENDKNIFIRNSDFISVINKSNVIINDSINVKTIGECTVNLRLFGMAVDADNMVWYSTFDSVYKILNGKPVPQLQFGNFAFKWMYIVDKYLVGISFKNQLVVCNNFTSKIKDTATSGENCIWDKLYKLNDSTFLISTENHYWLLHLYYSTGAPTIKLRTIENPSMPEHAEYICSNDSFCFFFNKGSITRLPVNNLFINHETPKILFKTLKTRDSSYPIVPGTMMNIEYKESKNINISFAPFSFGSKYITCEYSISTDTADYWRKVHNNEINLFDPGYGNYIVKVKARTLSGDFSEPFVFSFTILKPFWATWWFISLCAFVFIISIALIVRAIILQRTRKREIKHKNEIKFLRSEYRALNALMNPHFIFNTLNNVQWLVNNGDKMAANHYLRIFSDLVRQNMSNISKELIPLNDEIELVRNYLKLEKLRFKDALNYEININDDIDLYGIKIPPLLIQPLVENAIKHGILPGADTSNLLTVNIYAKNNKLYIDITDNGIGINESQKRSRSLHKSTGIENIRNRIEKLSLMHDIYIALSITEIQNGDGKPAGTLARIGIDIHEE